MGDINDIELAEGVFGVPLRRDILARAVNWQLAKRRAGTHKAKGRSDVIGSTAKRYRQKGTGRARIGSGKVSQYRGGGAAFGGPSKERRKTLREQRKKDRRRKRRKR